MHSITLLIIGQIQVLPLIDKQIQTATRQNGILSQVFHYVKTRWPSHIDEIHKPFVNQEHELSIEAEWLLWVYSVIIFTKLRSCLVAKPYRQHPGA